MYITILWPATFREPPEAPAPGSSVTGTNWSDRVTTACTRRLQYVMLSCGKATCNVNTNMMLLLPGVHLNAIGDKYTMLMQIRNLLPLR